LTSAKFKILHLKTAHEALASLISHWYTNRIQNDKSFDFESAIELFLRQTHSWDSDLWRSAALLASMHGISQLTYRILKECPHEQLDPYFRIRISQQTELNKERLGLQKKEAIDVISILNNKVITNILIKGLCHAYTLYTRPYLRPMADVDLVVRSMDFERAIETMISIGYVIEQRSQLEASLCLSDNCEYPYIWSDHPDNGRGVDLHCGLRSYPLNVPITFDDSYLDDCMTYSLEEHTVTGLSLYDSIAITALGITNDMFMQHFRLIKLIDLILLVEKLPEPEKLAENFSKRSVRIMQYVYPAFALADRIFPDSSAEILSRSYSRYANNNLKNWMKGIDPFELSFASPNVREPITFLRMKMVMGCKDKLTILSRRIMPPKKWSHQKLRRNGKRLWKQHYKRLFKRVPAILKRNPRRTELEIPGFE
jgi:hypothetical protein